jgi:lipoyl(octanoyl) transferase
MIDYAIADDLMKRAVESIYTSKSVGKLWMLEHHHVYTQGMSADTFELLKPDMAPVYKAARGGKSTYHGPGQRVIYTMFNLKKLHKDKPDIRLFVNQLEDWVIASLAEVGVEAYKVPERVGIWIYHEMEEKKIAAIGIRLYKWVSYHGIAINIDPDLSYFSGIIPCGLKGFGVCSLKSLGIDISMQEFDAILLKNFYSVFKTHIVSST